MTINPDEIDQLFFTPPELQKIYVEYGDYIKSIPGVKFHIKSLDEYVIPPRPGQVVVAVARPGQGKTSFAIAWSKKTVDDILNRKSDECVVYITYDQVVEEIYAMYAAEEGVALSDYAWGRISHDDLVKNSIKHMGEQFWVIGKSVVRRDRQADMTFENIAKAILRMEEKYKIKPSLIVIDYIQNISIKNKEKRQDAVAEASIQAKELGKTIACPILALAQAGRQVDISNTKIPGLSDCQHSSQLEQDATKVFGLMRPSIAMPDKEFIEVGDKKKIPITDNLMLLQVSKQRMSGSGKVFPLYLNPSTLKMEDLHVQKEDEWNPNW